MNTPTVVADFELDSNNWNIEGHQLIVNSVSVFHPHIQHGLEKDLYSEILAPELYGMIRSWRPPIMLVTPTDPILVVLDYGLEDQIDYYTIDWDAYLIFKDYFVGSGAAIQNSNWAEEGF